MKFISDLIIRRFFIVLQFLLGGLFLWSGTSKMANPIDFLLTIEAFGLLPVYLLDITTFTLILIEIIVGIGIILGQKNVVRLSLVLMLLFIVVLSYGIYKKIGIDCGCFGGKTSDTASTENLKSALIRDIFITSGLLIIYWKGCIINYIKSLRRINE